MRRWCVIALMWCQSALGHSFEQLKTPHFVIEYTPAAAQAAALLANNIESIRADCVQILGRDVNETITLRMGQGRQEFEAIAPFGRPPEYALALAWPDQRLVLLDAATLARPDAQATLRHELFHALLGQIGTGWPRWFQEGLAQNLTRERDFKRSHFDTLVQAVHTDSLFAFSSLASGFPSEPHEVDIAYAQSAEFLSYLKSHHPPESFETLFDRMQVGDNFEKAFGIAFRSPLSMEENNFRAELPKRFPWWTMLLATEASVWLVASGLMLWAHQKRRREFEIWRVAQLEIEAFEDFLAQLAPDDSEIDPIASVGKDASSFSAPDQLLLTTLQAKLE
jgi:hypothetical protein